MIAFIESSILIEYRLTRASQIGQLESSQVFSSEHYASWIVHVQGQRQQQQNVGLCRLSDG